MAKVSSTIDPNDPQAAAFARQRQEHTRARTGDAAYFASSGRWIWSIEACQLFRIAHSPEGPSLETILARIHPKDLVAWREALTTWHNGKPLATPVDFRVVSRDGSTHWLRIPPGVSLPQPAGEICLFYTIEDVSREKVLEEEMERAMEHERELSRVKMEFLHMVTHEYRTPLGVIQSSADILIRYHDRLPEKERLGRLEDIKSSTRILADLVEDVLLIGKSESGRDTLHRGSVCLCSLLREIADATVENFGFPREVFIKADDREKCLISDEQLLRHAFSNAISNALKYSTLDKAVTILVETLTEEVVVRVKDEGIGIPQEDLSRLFRMFYRASNVGSIAGTGLGLVVLKRCVDRLGGRIEVDSVPDAGTTFSFFFPDVPAQSAQ